MKTRFQNSMFATQPFQLTLFLPTTYLDMQCTVLKVRSGCGGRCATLPRQAYCAVSGGGAYMQGAKKKEKLSKDPFLFSPEVRQRAAAAAPRESPPYRSQSVCWRPPSKWHTRVEHVQTCSLVIELERTNEPVFDTLACKKKATGSQPAVEVSSISRPVAVKRKINITMWKHGGTILCTVQLRIDVSGTEEKTS